MSISESVRETEKEDKASDKTSSKIDTDISDDLGNSSDDENEPDLPPEYIAYRDYFFENYDTSDDQEYYIYFYDLEHRGIDDMIVVCPLYYSYDYLYRYNLTIYSYDLNASMRKIYESIDDSLNTYFIKQRDDCYYLGLYGNFNYEIIEFGDNGNQKTVDNGEEVSISVLSDCILLSTCNLSSFRARMLEFGINNSYCHDYRIVFSGSNCLREKEYNEWIWGNLTNEYGYLTDVLFANIDADNYEEVVAVYRQDEENDVISCNTLLIQDDNQRTVFNKYITLQTENFGVGIVQFGNVKGILCGDYDYDLEVPGPYAPCEVIILDKDKNICKKFNTETGFYAEDYAYMTVDKRGAPCLIGWGNNTYGLVPDPSSHFYIGYLNGRFFEYDSVNIDYDDLLVFSNYSEEIAKAERSLLEESKNSYPIDIFSIEINEILYSSNEMIYISYIADNGNDWEQNELTAVFRIEGNKIAYLYMERSGRKKSLDGVRERLDIDSFTRDFPY